MPVVHEFIIAYDALFFNTKMSLLLIALEENVTNVTFRLHLSQIMLDFLHYYVSVHKILIIFS